MNTKSPTTKQIADAREKAGHTPSQAAELVGRRRRQWNNYENGTTPMPILVWEAYLRRTQGKEE